MSDFTDTPSTNDLHNPSSPHYKEPSRHGNPPSFHNEDDDGMTTGEMERRAMFDAMPASDAWERAEFEKWIEEKTIHAAARSTLSGEYFSAYTQNAWEAWQARAAL